MEIFWLLGQAAAGIFIAVLLSGILAGVIAYGLIDGWMRRNIQRSLIEDLLHRYRRHEMWTPLSPGGQDEQDRPPPRDFSPDGALYLPHVLALVPDDFFGLPYRQLCGQLAGRISADVASDAAGNGASDLSLFLARYIQQPDSAHASDGREEFRRTAQRALTWVDRLQIRLANGVTVAASRIAAQVVLLIYFALSLPFALGMASMRPASSRISTTVEAIGWSVVAIMIIAMLAYGSQIIARLTFGWIDRLASPR
ncbi:hypothetical protein [Sphingomonas bacterium]|uniref:hypothetical protein n=1 Tax=Sphingomonas bacterium TaxID=1895847 RepID=UPI00260F13CF|nr:hypothetical protein [Sphingomonas bacterium]MDB5677450.1 hypothetical protein [Sphingomonas bacterium]